MRLFPILIRWYLHVESETRPPLLNRSLCIVYPIHHSYWRSGWKMIHSDWKNENQILPILRSVRYSIAPFLPIICSDGSYVLYIHWKENVFISWHLFLCDIKLYISISHRRDFLISYDKKLGKISKHPVEIIYNNWINSICKIMTKIMTSTNKLWYWRPTIIA